MAAIHFGHFYRFFLDVCCYFLDTYGCLVSILCGRRMIIFIARAHLDVYSCLTPNTRKGTCNGNAKRKLLASALQSVP